MRLFLAWLERRELTPRLHVTWDAPGPATAPLPDEERFAALRRLLHDSNAAPRDRLTGCLLLLYAQPLTRTAALRTSDVALTADSQTTITLGRGAIVLPEPLGAIALALRDQHATTASNATEGWLMPGRNAGTHISAECLGTHLKAYGITSRPTRHAALLVLGARLPAPILAERLGFDQKAAPLDGFGPPAAPTPNTSRCGPSDPGHVTKRSRIKDGDAPLTPGAATRSRHFKS